MIIPVKCFTCGMVLGNKYRYYLQELRKENKQPTDNVNLKYLSRENMKETIEGKILTRLGLTKMCCRRHMLTHVDVD